MSRSEGREDFYFSLIREISSLVRNLLSLLLEINYNSQVIDESRRFHRGKC